MEKDLLEGSDSAYEDELTQVTQDDTARTNDFLSLVELETYVYRLLGALPKLNHNVLRHEMQNMNVPVKQTPHTADLNQGLALAQGYKDRLSEIYISAMREYKTRDRLMEMLFDAYNTTSKASSADKRKGEASLRYAVRLFQLQAAENFLKEVEHILANVKSAMDGISRQISLFDLQLKLGDVRRGRGNPAEESSGELDWTTLE